MREPRLGESKLELRIPVRAIEGDYLYVAGIFPLTGVEWRQMLDVLNAMRPALVKDVEP